VPRNDTSTATGRATSSMNGMNTSSAGRLSS
jgi:hypothetical protein